jgi:hypothetical protein
MAKAWLMLLGLAAGLVVMNTLPAQAATLEVCRSGCPYSTIQQALAAAANGDTISVAPGTYPGGFTIGKNVTVVGSGASRTTVRGTGGVGVGITVASGVTAAIEALTVDAAGAARAADAVYNYGTLTVQGATVTGSNGNAALLSSGALTLDHSTVSGNNTTGVRNTANPTVPITPGTVTIYRSTITGNAGDAGIVNGEFDTMTIAGSTITGNAGQTAGGIDNSGALSIRASTISGNNAGGIANGVNGTQGPTATLTLHRDTIKDNFGGPVGGIWNGINGVARLHRALVARNTGGTYGGIYNQGTLTLRHSTVKHNIPNNCVGC